MLKAGAEKLLAAVSDVEDVCIKYGVSLDDVIDVIRMIQITQDIGAPMQSNKHDFVYGFLSGDEE